MNADAFLGPGGPHEFGARRRARTCTWGRRAYSIFRAIGNAGNVTVDYVPVVDTLRCPRARPFARHLGGVARRNTAMRSASTRGVERRSRPRAYFDDMIATIRDEDAYGRVVRAGGLGAWKPS